MLIRKEPKYCFGNKLGVYKQLNLFFLRASISNSETKDCPYSYNRLISADILRNKSKCLEKMAGYYRGEFRSLQLQNGERERVGLGGTYRITVILDTAGDNSNT
jgi:hypothetical protein